MARAGSIIGVCINSTPNIAGFQGHIVLLGVSPLMANDLFLLRPAIREEAMVPLIKLYTVAFWKTFLEGDRRYMPYLTPGFAHQNEFDAFVEIK